ncbi:VOC family protein [Micromonospora maritima]|uniref:VOC family protein n=1 Tax=Micromonospora maritima TaxID=986711 RepID=A0ABW7ZSX8_9ACTN
MERVTGIGGVFFRAHDPDRVNRWYATHLGVDLAPESYEVSSWWQQAGPTVLAAMPPDAEHFGGSGHSWSLNFRVADLDAMVAQIRGAGIAVEVDPEEYPNGRFASLRDPEGNVVQLWQPDGADSRGPQD